MVDREGQGVLLVMTDVEPEHEDEFNLWYDTEHMSERMSVPGFLDVRRFQAASGGLKYCALYRTESIATFESEAYRAKLAAQTDWSKRMLGTFVEPNRIVGCVGRSTGHGSGGWLAILRYDAAAWGDVEKRAALVSAIADARGIVAVDELAAVPRLSGPVKEYRPVTVPVLKADDHLLLVEGSDTNAVAAEKLRAICEGFGVSATHLGIYSFSWGLPAPAAS